MAKKSKSPNIPEQTLARARAELYGSPTAVVKSNDPSPDSKAASQQKAPLKAKKAYHAVTIDDLKAEYVYVITDIRNMAILALVLSVAMVAVSAVVV